MELSLRPNLAARFKSGSQIAKIVSEDWAGRELYCPACTADSLNAFPAGTRVSDFWCPSCQGRFQVKAKRGRFGPTVTNSAYEAKMEAIRLGTVPNYVFLGYDRSTWRVTSGFVVPGHFISASVVQRRNPLGPTARRAGWVGSNILLGLLPLDARLQLVENGQPRDPSAVRRDWRRFAFLREASAETRGWLGDTLRIIRELDRSAFHLSDLYAFEPELERLHPNNENIEPKIRQQVQLLRDRGILRPLGRGSYEVVS